MKLRQKICARRGTNSTSSRKGLLFCSFEVWRDSRSPSPCWMTLTKDFACLQCKYHPTWQKYLCPLNPMGVVAHHHRINISNRRATLRCNVSSFFMQKYAVYWPESGAASQYSVFIGQKMSLIG